MVLFKTRLPGLLMYDIIMIQIGKNINLQLKSSAKFYKYLDQL